MMDYQIGCMNLAATNIEQMVDFYRNVFGIAFSEQVIEGEKLYEGKFAGMDFVLLPAKLAGVTATDNRVQYDIYVPDVERVIRLATGHGGRTNGRLAEDDEFKCIGIFDPDNNFIVFKQRKTAR